MFTESNTKNTIHQSITLFNHEIWSFYYENKFGWFRIFGIGLKFKNILYNDLTFSERNGYKKTLKIGNWVISFLNKK